MSHLLIMPTCSIPNTSEVYTRSTTNYWIAGRRVYNRLAIRQQQMQASNTDDHQEPPTEDEEEEDHYDEGVMSDYVEMYLVAAKKDTSLADVEGNDAPIPLMSVC